MGGGLNLAGQHVQPCLPPTAVLLKHDVLLPVKEGGIVPAEPGDREGDVQGSRGYSGVASVRLKRDGEAPAH